MTNQIEHKHQYNCTLTIVINNIPVEIDCTLDLYQYFSGFKLSLTGGDVWLNDYAGLHSEQNPALIEITDMLTGIDNANTEFSINDTFTSTDS